MGCVEVVVFLFQYNVRVLGIGEGNANDKDAAGVLVAKIQSFAYFPTKNGKQNRAPALFINGGNVFPLGFLPVFELLRLEEDFFQLVYFVPNHCLLPAPLQRLHELVGREETQNTVGNHFQIRVDDVAQRVNHVKPVDVRVI